jgi:hypothetical protein
VACVCLSLLHPGSCRCLRIARNACLMSAGSLHQSHECRICSYLQICTAVTQAGAWAGGRGGAGWGRETEPWRGRKRCWWCRCTPPAFHLPGWHWRLPAPPLWTSAAPQQGRAVTPTTCWRWSGSVEQRVGMAAAADTGPLPVHPEAFASLTCMLR